MSEDNEISFKSLFVPLTVKKSIIILVLIGFVVYFNMLFNGFAWDDFTYIISNPELNRFNLIALIGKNTFNSSGYFRPLPAIYFSMLYNIFGTTPFFYHFFQLCLHITDTSLLFLIFRRFFKERVALLLSVLFLIHPINVESVAYIGASQSELLLLFGGIAFYLCMSDKLKIRRIFLIHLFLLLSLLTKEVSILFFAVIYLYRLLIKRKLSRLFVAISALSLSIYSAIRFLSLGVFLEKMHLIPISSISFGLRLAHIPIIFFYYIKTFFFPLDLAVDQIWTIKELTISNFYLPLLVDTIFLGSLSLYLLWLRRTKNKLWVLFSFFFTWFIFGMVMLLQIFPLDMTVADRWFYFPFVGILGMTGIILVNFQNNFSKHKVIVVTTLVIISLLLTVRTIVRNSNWINQLTLFTHDTRGYDNYDLENFIAVELVGLKQYDQALPHLLKAVRLLPHDTNLYNLGAVYEQRKDFKNALVNYKLVLDLKNPYFHNLQIRQLASEGYTRMEMLSDRPASAAAQISKSILEFPKDGTIWAYLAIVQYDLKNQEEALKASEKARYYLPNSTTILLYQKIREKLPLNLKLE